MKFRYTEIFYSVQGEGKFVGVPSVFLRMFGCNFTCQGFGMPKGELSTEYLDVDPNNYNSLNELPLVKTGCDSYASWDARFKDFTTSIETTEVVERLLSYTPNNRWIEPIGDQDIHLVITGGEPLLPGQQRRWPELFRLPGMENIKNVTFETNCTQLLRDSFVDFLTVEAGFETTFSCSPKLSVSGESWDTAINPEIALDYFSIPGSNMYFKFVVADEIDMVEVDKAVLEYQHKGVSAPTYCMPVGGCEAEYMENRTKVAEACLRKGYRYSPRLHVDLFGNNWGT